MPYLPAPVDLDSLLASCATRGIDLGLHRMTAALASGGHPERCFPAVQVAGTNGKGSIATFLHAILQAAGLRVGVYRSPHLQSWCERIQLGSQWVDGEILRTDLLRWLPLGEQHALTAFEVFTAAAFDRFAREDMDLVVLEVGLGGRLDATTAHPDRRVVGFGPIGMDHREFLGDTLEAIAAEKAGVISPGQVVISGHQLPCVAEVLERQSRIQGCQLRWVQPLATEMDGGEVLGCAGSFQRSNGAVAVAMARSLIEQGWAISEEAIRQGLRQARWPGRMERRSWRSRDVLLDGAHNPPGAIALRQELESLDGGESSPVRAGGRHWLLGIQASKDAPAMLDALLAPEDIAAIVAVSDLPSWTVAELLEARPELKGRLLAPADLHDALDWLATSDRLPVIAGSLHLLGQVWPLFDPTAPPDPARPTQTGTDQVARRIAGAG